MVVDAFYCSVRRRWKPEVADGMVNAIADGRQYLANVMTANRRKVCRYWLEIMFLVDEMAFPMVGYCRIMSDQVIQERHMAAAVEAELHGGRNWTILRCI